MPRNKESQTGGTKKARQAYQHHTEQRKVCIKHTNTMEVYLTSGHTQSIPRRDGCDYTSTSPQKERSMAKPRSREGNTEIKHRSKQANIDMQRKWSMSTSCGCSTTHRGNAHAHFHLFGLGARRWWYGGVSYLRCMIGIWVDFKDFTKGRWCRHQSLGFF